MNARSNDHHLKKRMKNGSPTVTQRTHNPPPFDEDNPHNNNNSKTEKEKRKRKRKKCTGSLPFGGKSQASFNTSSHLDASIFILSFNNKQKKIRKLQKPASQATDNE